MFRISVSGDWCIGYWWSLDRVDTCRTVKESGPYHTCDLANPRAVAWDDAVDWANRNDMPIESDVNPYRCR